MKKLTNLEAEFILTTYENTFAGNVNEEVLDRVLELIPQTTGNENYIAKMRALSTYVMTNYDQLEIMRTQIINDQTEHPEVSDKIVTPAGTEKPKRKYKRKAKPRGRRKK